jgi:hypothetical protein
LTDDLGDMRGVPHHLFGHTADIDTSTPETVSFDQRCPRAMVRSSTGGSNAPAAPADDQKVVSFSHIVSCVLSKMIENQQLGAE